MNFKKTMLVTAAAIALLSAFSNNAQAQSSGVSMPMYVWYVDVDRTHLGSGTTTLTFGPYDTYQEALNKKNEIDNWRGGPTVGYSDGRMYQRLNPKWYEMMNQIGRNITPRWPGMN